MPNGGFEVVGIVGFVGWWEENDGSSGRDVVVRLDLLVR